jgi:hypothetical protein
MPFYQSIAEFVELNAEFVEVRGVSAGSISEFLSVRLPSDPAKL